MGDEAASEFEERFVDIGSPFPIGCADGGSRAATQKWVTSLRLPPVSRTASGVPCPSSVDRRRDGVLPPFSALTWEESTTQRDQSSREAAFSSANRTSWSRCQCFLAGTDVLMADGTTKDI
ncbi:hypothetical protein SSRG_03894 [Streptomyces griseoflavus Tu4000]|uniref:Uncharacterized protein n=1 Tax=Streptomyces griseoflavus Tu4000 TaxID=467200 RepID=D9XXZ0_9ACTN|nr:hypothetical protein SSRG_03894 [Streptomyces griseoflavus Tu4000]